MDDTRGFSQELGEPIVSAAMEAVLKTVSYDEALVDGWVDAICDKVMDDLLKLKLPYKYTVTVVIEQHSGAGLHQAVEVHWDATADDVVVVKWPDKRKREQANSRLLCIVTVAGFAI